MSSQPTSWSSAVPHFIRGWASQLEFHSNSRTCQRWAPLPFRYLILRVSSLYRYKGDDTLTEAGLIKRRLSLDDQRIKSLASIEQWARKCSSEHRSTGTRNKCVLSGPLDLPTRLLDTRNTDNAIRLIETKDMQNNNAEYIALSHCWSLEPTIVTTISNIEMMRTEILMEKLPYTFRDAVTIAHHLNIRYLWIDSMCIIQGDRDDWEK